MPDLLGNNLPARNQGHVDRDGDPYAWAFAAKAALSRNPEVIGPDITDSWRSKCIEFHDRLVDAYRPSMRAKIDMLALWKRACRKVVASFADPGEPAPPLPANCPFALDDLIDADLDVEWLVGQATSPR